MTGGGVPKVVVAEGMGGRLAHEAFTVTNARNGFSKSY
jgi:hypothetical protein